MNGLSAHGLGGADALVARTGKTLVVLAGQSTGLSYGLTSTVTDTTLAAAYPAVQMRSHQSLVNDAVPTWTDTNGDLDSIIFESADRVGLEDTLMRDLDRGLPGRWAFSRMAVGGSTAAQWDPAGAYFAELIAKITADKLALGCTREVFCWEHGASEAKALANANAYLAWLGAFVAALRAAFPGMGFVYGRMSTLNSGVTFPYKTELRASQVAFESTLPAMRMVDSDAITITGVGGHYNGDEYLQLGHLYAPHVAAVMATRIPPLSQFTLAINNLDVTFTDASIAPGSTIVAWLWNFGDGATSTTQSPAHSYSNAGTYNVTLTTTNAAGDSNTSPASSVLVASALAVTRDAASSKYVPANATEFGTLLTYLSNPIATPNSLYNCQEASANLADSIGSLTMTWNGTAGLYQQAVSGWTRKAVAVSASTTTKFAAPSGQGPNPTSTSSLWLWFVDVTATPTALRQIAAVGGGSASFDGALAINTNGTMRVRCVGATVDGAVDVVAGGVRPFFLQYDRAHGVIRGGCDAEIVSGTYSASVVDSFKGVFAGGGGTAAAAACVWGCMWSGSNAEVSTAAIKSLLQGMGWTIAW